MLKPSPCLGPPSPLHHRALVHAWTEPVGVNAPSPCTKPITHDLGRRRCLALDPSDARAYVVLGKTLLLQKRYDEARALYQDGCSNTGEQQQQRQGRAAGRALKGAGVWGGRETVRRRWCVARATEAAEAVQAAGTAGTERRRSTAAQRSGARRFRGGLGAEGSWMSLAVCSSSSYGAKALSSGTPAPAACSLSQRGPPGPIACCNLSAAREPALRNTSTRRGLFGAEGVESWSGMWEALPSPLPPPNGYTLPHHTTRPAPAWPVLTLATHTRQQVQLVPQTCLVCARLLAPGNTNPYIWSAWGWLEAQTGNADRARKLYDAAVVVDGTHACAWHKWGMLEKAQGNYARARDLWMQVRGSGWWEEGWLRCRDTGRCVFGVTGADAGYGVWSGANGEDTEAPKAAVALERVLLCTVGQLGRIRVAESDSGAWSWRRGAARMRAVTGMACRQAAVTQPHATDGERTIAIRSVFALSPAQLSPSHASPPSVAVARCLRPVPAGHPAVPPQAAVPERLPVLRAGLHGGTAGARWGGTCLVRGGQPHGGGGGQRGAVAGGPTGEGRRGRRG